MHNNVYILQNYAILLLKLACNPHVHVAIYIVAIASCVLATRDVKKHDDTIAVCDLWDRGLVRAVENHVWNMGSKLLQHQ